MDSDFYRSIKKIITDRHESRKNECVNVDSNERILRVQGAARELKELIDVMEQLENPQKAGED